MGKSKWRFPAHGEEVWRKWDGMERSLGLKLVGSETKS